MATDLLAYRLQPPLLRTNQVSRPRLIRRLSDGLGSGHTVTLISAPAGFGKTTLATEWIGEQERSVVWLSLDTEDNDASQFVGYLIAALQQVNPSIGQIAQRLLQSPQQTSISQLMASVMNDIALADMAITLVLDDYQMIIESAIHQAVEFVLAHVPLSMHLVICTREDPPLPIARLRVRGKLTEVRERDLRFTAEEAADFLNQTMNLSVSSSTIKALTARTEGWAAGLQLVVLALSERQDDSDSFVAAFKGDDRFVVDYLMSEVLEHQPVEVRTFLTQTAILDEFNAALCNAITERSDS